jgi:hypothetical protein
LLLLLNETVTSAATCCSFVDDKAGVVTVNVCVGRSQMLEQKKRREEVQRGA